MSHVGPPQPQAAQSVFPKSHVGFDSITTQIEKKLLKRGFQFNVICVGKSSRRYQYMISRGRSQCECRGIDSEDAPDASIAGHVSQGNALGNITIRQTRIGLGMRHGEHCKSTC
jgi:septin family protein